MQQIIISVILSILGSGVLSWLSLKMLQILQLSSYKARGVWAWLKRTNFQMVARYFALAFFCFVPMFVFCMCFPLNPARYIGLIFFVGISAFFIYLNARQKQKTRLKFTKRIIRLMVLQAIIFLCLSFLTVYFTLCYFISYSLLGALPFFIPPITVLAHLIILPLEKLINSGYKKRATKKLSNSIIKIAITGSYGKTTAKNILCTILQKRFKTLSSPSSHNTPMGLCKLINGTEDDYEVLIAEMGARHRGDIKELCDLIHPDYGIITTVGTQHLETFKTPENILKTKLELAECAKTCVVNSDDTRLMGALKDKSRSCQFLYSGTAGADASFKDVKVGADGTSFAINIRGEAALISTRLLGRHIPALFTQCALLAHILGVEIDHIVQAALEIQPIEHRLQLIKSAHGTVIDDAYNSNPEGAKNALEVLSMFSGQRVVITPGFVELGVLERDKNQELGQSIATSADYLIAVKNADIYQSAIKKGMDKAFLEQSLDAAMQRLRALNLKDQVVLFLNDLPDNY